MKSPVAENLEAAFRAYCSCGGNLKEAVKLLKAQGIDLSHPTLSRWATKYKYAGRLKEADAVLLADLLGRDDIGRWLSRLVQTTMLHIEEHPEDTQASYALLGYLRVYARYAPETTGNKMTSEQLKQWQKKAAWVLREDYGVERTPDSFFPPPWIKIQKEREAIFLGKKKAVIKGKA